ncbi:MAG: hypothetical protein FJ087_12110, partial [Deltaproteobacteria bacterium]|nr:hypothetical protein [Deltaproteobacteria bacterium]
MLALLSRIMAFRVLGTIIFSLDTGVYVAALLTTGAGPATLVVFSAMLIRGMYEHGKRELVDRDHWPLAVTGAKLLFGPAVTAALTLMLGTLFSPDSLFGAALKPSVAGQHPVWGSVAVL